MRRRRLGCANLPRGLWTTQRDNVCFLNFFWLVCVFLVCRLSFCLCWIPFMRRSANLPRGLWTTQRDRERVEHEEHEKNVRFKEVYAEEEAWMRQPPKGVVNHSAGQCLLLKSFFGWCVFLVCKLSLCLRWIPFMRRSANLPWGLWTTQQDREREEINLFEMDPRTRIQVQRRLNKKMKRE